MKSKLKDKQKLLNNMKLFFTDKLVNLKCAKLKLFVTDELKIKIKIKIEWNLKLKLNN